MQAPSRTRIHELLGGQHLAQVGDPAAISGAIRRSDMTHLYTLVSLFPFIMLCPSNSDRHRSHRAHPAMPDLANPDRRTRYNTHTAESGAHDNVGAFVVEVLGVREAHGEAGTLGSASVWNRPVDAGDG